MGEPLVSTGAEGQHRLVLVSFCLAMFAGALLLFSVEPMFAKMVLPLLGGTPAVWNTCTVFFQVVLVLGYGYAHLTSRWLGARHQAVVHLLVLCAPLALLPIHLPGWTPPTGNAAIPWLLGLLAIAVGLPFFALSTTAPLFQRWFAQTGHPSAGDPYFLYATSNAGSLLALLAYPVLIEPRLRLVEQACAWAAAYAVFLGLASVCALLIFRAPVAHVAADKPAPAERLDRIEDDEPVGIGRQAWWVILASVPASLLLGVTTHLSTDVAPVPLMWIVPLSLYLLSFILVFAKRRPVPHRWMVFLLPAVVLPLVVVMSVGFLKPLGVLILLHLAAFFVMAMVCHGELADDRPAAEHLTRYYFWISVGGALGGLFNALVAPLVFDTVIEYPLAIVAACLLWPGLGDLAGCGTMPPAVRGSGLWVRGPEPPTPNKGKFFSSLLGDEPAGLNWLDVVLPLAVGALVAGQSLAAQAGGVETRPLRALLIALPAAMVCGVLFRRRPVRFGLGVAAVLFSSLFVASQWRRTLLVRRSFFGVYRVTNERGGGPFHALCHGTTLHGMQSLEPNRRREPLTYFHPNGPLGQIFDAFAGPTPRLRRVGVVGLGTGSSACYGSPGQRWTFYEIDPAVERIATDPQLFTFLRDCLETYEIVLGDARLSLERAPDQGYDLLILDAFSSDAIPLHLMTRQAVQLYLRKLAPGGLLAFHITNRHLTLKYVLARLAEAQGLTALLREDHVHDTAEVLAGRTSAHWLVMARRPEELGSLLADHRWESIRSAPTTPLWTDDFSNLLSVFEER